MKARLLAFTLNHGDFRFQLIKEQLPRLPEIYIQYEFSTCSYSTLLVLLDLLVYWSYWSQLDEMGMEQKQDKQHRLIALQPIMLGQTSGSIPLQ